MNQMIFENIDKMSRELTEMEDDIFDHPELGFKEFYAYKLLTDSLRKNGFEIEEGTADMPTAFRAVYRHGEGGPSIGLLCEYDALEGMGHACGHHMQGPAVLGAAYGVKEICGTKPYRLVVYGTPAEETAGGKILMKQKGCFQDIDIALMMHPSPTTTTDVKCMALSTYHVTFKGTPAHAAMNPEKGRSALDAILLACHGIECLREHVKEDTRLHYTILYAGGPSNVVPAEASVEFCMRSYNSDYLSTVEQRVKKIIKGASLMTETDYDIEEKPFFQGKIPVLSLNNLLMDMAEMVNAPAIRSPREKTGSTDFGNVMYDVPGSCIRVAFVPEGTSAHSKEYLDAGKSEAAHMCTVTAAKILAGACVEMIESEDLFKRIKEDFRKTKAGMQIF